ncbi:MAG TPA: hypothetical protein VNK23_04050 [Candidatus Dormibacteraeota bacterium]|nr:hypothetical protein [Candidatus Dormibacteraeota bacterium]
MPRKYQAEMKIFVNRDRAETVVTPDMSTAVAPVPAVSQEDMNSEVELITSADLLDKVVVSCGLDGGQRSWWTRFSERLSGYNSTPAAHIAESERSLRDALTVEPLQKTTIIRVAYSSRNPKLAARVLQTLATLYQEKHAAVHRPSGTLKFFAQQTALYRSQLASAEARRIDFDEQQGVFAPAAQQQLVLDQLSKFQTELQLEQADAYAAAARAKALRAEETSAPQRQTTQMRQAGNAQLLAELRGTLLSLELKRTDMLVKYAPSYPPVKDVETQIAQTQKAILAAEHSPVAEVTTDRVPAQDWIETELAKAEADRAQFAARATSLRSIVRQYQNAAETLNQIADTQTDLTRAVKSSEDNYLLYLRKREEARISDALDERRIVNVSMAEAPTVPALPTSHPGWLLLGGLFAAGITSLGAAYAADAMDASFRTPDELHRYLELKVLAAIPRSTS